MPGTTRDAIDTIVTFAPKGGIRKIEPMPSKEDMDDEFLDMVEDTSFVESNEESIDSDVSIRLIRGTQGVGF